MLRVWIRHLCAVGGVCAAIAISACSSGETSEADPTGGYVFLSQTRKIPARAEWTREVMARKGGTIRFRVTSQAPFGIIVLTSQAFQAVKSGNRAAFKPSDVLLVADSPTMTYEGEVTLPAGSSWFIIENRSDTEVEFHLQCTAP